MKYINFIVGIIIATIAVVIMVLIYNDKISQNSPLYYKQGVEFYNKGDYQNAYYNFGKIKWISPLYPISLFRQAKSAQKVGDYETAAIKYDEFLKKTPHSVFAINARKNLAKVYYYLKKYDEAKKEYEKLNDKTTNYIPEKDYFKGVIEKSKDKKQAAQYFLNYLNNTISNKEVSRKYVLLSADELSSLSIDFNNNELKTIAIAYFNSQKYDKALMYFSKIPQSECWDYLVLSNHYVGNKQIAKKLIETGIVSNIKNAQVDNVNKIYDIYASYFSSSKLNTWKKINQIASKYSLKGHDYVMYKLAGFMPDNEAYILYYNISQKYPEGNYAAESLWNVIWNYYTKREYTKALDLANKHLKTYQNVKSTPKVMFWIYKIQTKQGKTTEAHNMLSKLANKYPDNYYGLRADSILNKNNDFWQTNHKNRLPLNKEVIEFPLSLSQIEIKDLKIINEIFESGDYEIWQDADFNNPIIDSWIEYKKGKKTHSIILARDFIDKMDIKPPFLSAAYKLNYPLYYVEEINIAGSKLKIDSFLITALIREESHFNENAKSSVNASGLMQLMPATMDYIMKKFGVNYDKDTSDITNPRLNLYAGCHYLKYLKERFNNNDLYVIAAYNGGEGSVSKWINTYNIKDNDEFIENIPYAETQNYVKKVFKTYHMYKKIYE